MNDEMKYCELLKDIGELLFTKNRYISMRDFQIEQLKSQLEKAEKQIETLKEQNCGRA